MARLAVHNQNLARLQAAVVLNFLGVDMNAASLRSQNQAAVGGNGVARGAQAVAVEHTASIAAVGENERGRAVPRLHQN